MLSFFFPGTSLADPEFIPLPFLSKLRNLPAPSNGPWIFDPEVLPFFLSPFVLKEQSPPPLWIFDESLVCFFSSFFGENGY